MKYHFIGMGGIGMSALARIFLQKGHKVSGSDLSFTPILSELQQRGATVFIGHKAEQIPDHATVIYSGIIGKDNPEIERTLELKLPLLHRSDLLKELMEGHQPLLVAGTHGKTTTTSLLTHVFLEGGKDPSFAIGGFLANHNTNGSLGHGDTFIAETDESDGSFLNLCPFGAILTNVEEEHMNYWKTKEQLINGFSLFAKKVISKEHLFWCYDDPILFGIHPKGISYGFSECADLRAVNVREQGWISFFDIQYGKRLFSDLELSLIGRHNILNALAVFGLSLRFVDEKFIREAFKSFKGVKRRLEKKGEWRGIPIFDDYGHHPTEIKVTIQALKRAIGKKRLVVAFQPHRYSRTSALFNEFITSFEGADLLILTDVYSAGEVELSGVTGHHLFTAIKTKTTIPCLFSPREALEEQLTTVLSMGDVLLTLGAGDITQVGSKILS